MAPEAFALLSPPLKRLLHETGISKPTPPQVEAIPLIAQGDNVLIIAPTGSGKTEAALLPLIDRMIRNNDRQGISLVYITPLRALNRDLLKRLQTWSSKLGFSVEVRHGDTPAKDRRRMAVKPPDLLITTPETLQAVLPGRRMREHLRHVRSVIVDEIHELAGDRRGVQLTVGLERLREICVSGFQRVGLSATVGNPEEIALFLGGNQPVKIVQVPLTSRPCTRSNIHLQEKKIETSLDDSTLHLRQRHDLHLSMIWWKRTTRLSSSSTVGSTPSCSDQSST